MDRLCKLDEAWIAAVTSLICELLKPEATDCTLLGSEGRRIARMPYRRKAGQLER
jgi:hypothetical protein